jgi:hypothetical protein
MIEFAAETLFFSVNGIPVTVGAGPGATPPWMYCAAWDVRPPRRFPMDGPAASNALSITREKFMEMIGEGAPMDFAPGAVFFDVGGIPVAMGVGGDAALGLPCAAWDQAHPRPFDPAVARRDGAPITHEKFFQLITARAIDRVKRGQDRSV